MLCMHVTYTIIYKTKIKRMSMNFIYHKHSILFIRLFPMILLADLLQNHLLDLR